MPGWRVKRQANQGDAGGLEGGERWPDACLVNGEMRPGWPASETRRSAKLRMFRNLSTNWKGAEQHDRECDQASFAWLANGDAT